jgi:hypothetical protein
MRRVFLCAALFACISGPQRSPEPEGPAPAGPIYNPPPPTPGGPVAGPPMESAGTQVGTAPNGAPALIVGPTEGSRAALWQAVTDLMDGRRPALMGDDALTRQSTLYLERTARRDAEGRRLEGRDRSLPESFHLVKSGPDCILVRDRTGRWALLVATRCTESR